MKSKFIKYGLFLLSVSLMVGCSSKSATYLDAANGKRYYIDVTTCDTYKIHKGKAYCYTDDNNCQVTVYQPVTSGCQTKVCGKSHTLEK